MRRDLGREMAVVRCAVGANSARTVLPAQSRRSSSRWQTAGVGFVAPDPVDPGTKLGTRSHPGNGRALEHVHFGAPPKRVVVAGAAIGSAALRILQADASGIKPMVRRWFTHNGEGPASRGCIRPPDREASDPLAPTLTQRCPHGSCRECGSTLNSVVGMELPTQQGHNRPRRVIQREGAPFRSVSRPVERSTGQGPRADVPQGSHRDPGRNLWRERPQDHRHPARPCYPQLASPGRDCRAQSQR